MTRYLMTPLYLLQYNTTIKFPLLCSLCHPSKLLTHQLTNMKHFYKLVICSFWVCVPLPQITMVTYFPALRENEKKKKESVYSELTYNGSALKEKKKRSLDQTNKTVNVLQECFIIFLKNMFSPKTKFLYVVSCFFIWAKLKNCLQLVDNFYFIIIIFLAYIIFRV